MGEMDKPGRGTRGGPRSTAGKAASSRNATKEGIWAAWKDADEQLQYDQLVQELLTEYGPASPTVKILVDRLATAAVKLKRIQRVEDAMYQKARIIRAHIENTPHENSLSSMLASLKDGHERALEIGTAATMPDVDRLDTLLRYETSFERTIFRCLQMLKVLKDEQPRMEGVLTDGGTGGGTGRKPPRAERLEGPKG